MWQGTLIPLREPAQGQNKIAKLIYSKLKKKKFLIVTLKKVGHSKKI